MKKILYFLCIYSAFVPYVHAEPIKVFNSRYIQKSPLYDLKESHLQNTLSAVDKHSLSLNFGDQPTAVASNRRAVARREESSNRKFVEEQDALGGGFIEDDYMPEVFKSAGKKNNLDSFAKYVAMQTPSPKTFNLRELFKEKSNEQAKEQAPINVGEFFEPHERNRALVEVQERAQDAKKKWDLRVADGEQFAKNVAKEYQTRDEKKQDAIIEQAVNEHLKEIKNYNQNLGIKNQTIDTAVVEPDSQKSLVSSVKDKLASWWGGDSKKVYIPEPITKVTLEDFVGSKNTDLPGVNKKIGFLDWMMIK